MKNIPCRRILSMTFALLLMTSSSALRAENDHAVGEGAVYTMSNDPAGNAVLMFRRSAHGALTPSGTFSTGGLGTGGKEPDFGLGNARADSQQEESPFAGG